MSEQLSQAPDVKTIARDSGIAHPNGRPYSHITFAMVAWNEEARIEPLLKLVRPAFETLIVGVQKSDDRTLEIAREWADIVIEDDRSGYGDSTFGPKLLPLVKTRWTFRVDADEKPDRKLLASLSSATWYAENSGHDGIWIPFRSSVEGIEYEEQHSHLRLFETWLGWPGMLHSRPPAKSMVLWPHGHIRHDRSLDEMMQDYLRYWDRGRGDAGWEAHNKLMMHSACSGVAEVKGWDFVRSFEWWPDVEAIAFKEET